MKSTEDTNDNAQLTTHNAQSEQEKTERELKEMMGPAAASSIGYESRETEREKRESKTRRQELFDKHAPTTALKAVSAQCTMQNARSQIKPRRGALFGRFWREGELAVLVGASGVGKSILAMQIAEAAARGSAVNSEQGTVNSEESLELSECVDDGGIDHPGLPATPPDPGGESADLDFDPLAEANGNRRVLYIDLERTEIQRVERYLGYEFAEGLEWMDVGAFGWMHSKYKGSVTRFLVASVMDAIVNREPDVVIIDNLTYLLRARQRSVDLLTLMKTLRRYVNDNGTSILLLAHSDRQVRSNAQRTAHNAQFRELSPLQFQMAPFVDGIFELCQSTMGKTFRYVKSLFPGAESEVWSAELGGSPFLGFEFVGMMEEEAHLRDYVAHAKMVAAAVKRAEERFGQRRRKLRAAVPSRVSLRGIEAVGPAVLTSGEPAEEPPRPPKAASTPPS